MVVKTNSAGVVTPSQQFKPTTTTATPAPVTAPVSRKGEQGGTTTVASTVTTPVKPAPIVTSKIPAPKTNAQMAAEAQNVLDKVNAINTKFDQPATEDAKGGAVVAATPTVISTYTDNQGNRIAVMSDGTTKNLGKTESATSETNQINAIQNLTSLFNSYGIGGEIATALAELVKKGYSSDTISSIAQDPTSTDPVAVAFQKRFAGNAGRIKAGLAPYDPSTYLNVEKSFVEALKSSGLPSGFYDTKDQFAKWIGSGVAPAEVTRRIGIASDVLESTDPTYLQQMQSLYGLDKSHALAHLLDPEVAKPLIDRQVNAVKFAAAAQRAGLGTTKSIAEQAAELGINEAEASKGFGTIAGQQAELQRLAAIQGLEAGKVGEQLTSSTFSLGDFTKSKASLEQATGAELGRFSGGSGIGKGSLGIEETGII
jgi:hypothetical protein